MTPRELVDKFATTTIPYDTLTGLIGTDAKLDIAIQHALKKYMHGRFATTDSVEYANKLNDRHLSMFLNKFDYVIPDIVRTTIAEQFGFNGYLDIKEHGDEGAKRAVVIGTIDYYKKN